MSGEYASIINELETEHSAMIRAAANEKRNFELKVNATEVKLADVTIEMEIAVTERNVAENKVRQLEAKIEADVAAAKSDLAKEVSEPAVALAEKSSLLVATEKKNLELESEFKCIQVMAKSAAESFEKDSKIALQRINAAEASRAAAVSASEELVIKLSMAEEEIAIAKLKAADFQHTSGVLESKPGQLEHGIGEVLVDAASSVAATSELSAVKVALEAKMEEVQILNDKLAIAEIDASEMVARMFKVEALCGDTDALRAELTVLKKENQEHLAALAKSADIEAEAMAQSVAAKAKIVMLENKLVDAKEKLANSIEKVEELTGAHSALREGAIHTLAASHEAKDKAAAELVAAHTEVSQTAVFPPFISLYLFTSQAHDLWWELSLFS